MLKKLRKLQKDPGIILPIPVTNPDLHLHPFLSQLLHQLLHQHLHLHLERVERRDKRVKLNRSNRKKLRKTEYKNGSRN